MLEVFEVEPFRFVLRLENTGRSRDGNEQPRNQICNLSGDADEELLMLSSVHQKRLYSSLIVSDRQVRFLLNSGLIVNLLLVRLA